MRIAVVSCWLNECDLAEVFVRHYARLADRVFIVDESTDKTPEILQRLGDEGLPVSLLVNHGRYEQARTTTEAVRAVAEVGNYDLVLVVDADEFLQCTREELEREAARIPAGHVGSVDWETWVPKWDDPDRDRCQDRPLSCFARRTPEGARFSKVLVPGGLAKDICLVPGNHAAYYSTGTVVPAWPMAMKLGHVPVRSAEQVIAKTVLAAATMAAKPGRGAQEAFHVDDALAELRRFDFCLYHHEVQAMAERYAVPKDGEYPTGVDEEARMVGSDISVRWPELAVAKAMPAIVEGYLRMARELRQMREREMLR